MLAILHNFRLQNLQLHIRDCLVGFKGRNFLRSCYCFLPEEGLQWERSIRERGLDNILKQRRPDTYLCGNAKRQSGISAGKRLSVPLHLEKMGLTCPRSRFYGLLIAHSFKDLACSFMCKLTIVFFVSWEVLVLLFAFYRICFNTCSFLLM